MSEFQDSRDRWHKEDQSKLNKTAFSTSIKAAKYVREGIEEKDLAKTGEGLAVIGLAGTGAATVGGATPAVAATVTGWLGATAGATVATAFLPVSLGVLAVGGVIWGIGKLRD